MSKSKSHILLLLRVFIGWHLLYEGLIKLFTPGWSSAGYLEGSYGFLSGFFHALASSPSALQAVNFLNIWGLVLIGTGLFVGILIRFSAVSGVLLLLLYYFAYPPFGLSVLNSYQEGHYWIINRNLIEGIALMVVILFPVMEFSLLNLFKRFRIHSPKESEIPEGGNKRRELLKSLVTLPFFGGVVYAAAKAHTLEAPDSLTGATTVLKTYDLKDLKGVLPKGKIGNMEMSRLVMGCNLIGGWSHSRDLHYVASLFRHYNTERKIFETYNLCEQAGIDTTNLVTEFYPLFNRYKKATGSKMKSICQAHVFPLEPDPLVQFKKSVDEGATTLYIQGGCCDKLVKDGRLDMVMKALEYTRSQGLLAGVGGHSIQTPIACMEAGIRPDYYFKTMHHDKYWSAHPVENREEFSVIGENSPDHNKFHDNMFDLFPGQTIDLFNKIDVPLFGFKVLSGGAIMPEDGFRYAFENGSDFICVGMFDFQIVEDVNLVTAILAGNLKRKRPWYS